MTLRHFDQANDELQQALFRYGLKSLRRADSFRENYRRALKRILANPRTYPLEQENVKKEIRSISVDKFPFSVVYEVLDKEVVILGLWHQHGQSEVWSLREA